MLNNDQVKLVQTAVRKAGIRGPGSQDGRYRLLLRQYLQPNGEPVESCKQLNNTQLDDILAICEAHGWRMPGQSETHYRDKVSKAADDTIASYGQQQAISFLAQDLGFDNPHLANFIKFMTYDEMDSVAGLTPKQAWKITEALTAMIRRKTGINFKNLNEIRKFFENKGAKDGKKTSQNANN